MKIANLNSGVRSFLNKNPFVFMHRDELRGYFLCDQDHPLKAQELQSLAKSLFISGLDCLTINCGQGFTKESMDIAKSNATQRLYLEDTTPEKYLRKIDL